MKSVEVPATTRIIEDYVSCDLCGDRMHEHGKYEIDDVEIKHRTGVQYPEGGWGEEARVDMCGKCFVSKLIPWLESEDATISKKEWGW
jgi:hypothetical protein